MTRNRVVIQGLEAKVRAMRMVLNMVSAVQFAKIAARLYRVWKHY
jgi:hypothetical protein